MPNESDKKTRMFENLYHNYGNEIYFIPPERLLFLLLGTQFTLLPQPCQKCMIDALANNLQSSRPENLSASPSASDRRTKVVPIQHNVINISNVW